MGREGTDEGGGGLAAGGEGREKVAHEGLVGTGVERKVPKMGVILIQNAAVDVLHTDATVIGGERTGRAFYDCRAPLFQGNTFEPHA